MEFSYPLYKISFLLLSSAFLLSYVLTPIVRRLAINLNILDTPSLDRKIHKKPVPLLGGLAIFISFVITLVFLYLIISYHLFIGGPHFFVFGSSNLFWIKLGLYLLCSLLILVIGILDDLRSIDFRLKLAVQSLSALIIIFGGATFSLFHNPILNSLFTFFWIVGITNSFNLLDNMNGLSTSISITVVVSFILLSYFTHHYLFTLFMIIPLGCLLGFLPYNFPKAQIFLGDTGSLFIGFSIATFSVWLNEHLTSLNLSHWLTFASLVLVLGIPVLDTISVIIVRLLHHKPIYVGDTNHLSHRLVRQGFSSALAVMLLVTGSIVLGSLGLLSVLN